MRKTTIVLFVVLFWNGVGCSVFLAVKTEDVRARLRQTFVIKCVLLHLQENESTIEIVWYRETTLLCYKTVSDDSVSLADACRSRCRIDLYGPRNTSTKMTVSDARADDDGKYSCVFRTDAARTASGYLRVSVSITPIVRLNYTIGHHILNTTCSVTSLPKRTVVLSFSGSPESAVVSETLDVLDDGTFVVTVFASIPKTPYNAFCGYLTCMTDPSSPPVTRSVWIDTDCATTMTSTEMTTASRKTMTTIARSQNSDGSNGFSKIVPVFTLIALAWAATSFLLIHRCRRRVRY